MSTELHLSPAYKPPKALPKDTECVALSRLRILDSRELAREKADLTLLKSRVLVSLRHHFSHMAPSQLSRLASSPASGSVQSGVLHLPMVYTTSKPKVPLNISKIIIDLADPSRKISHFLFSPPQKDSDAYVWACQSKESLDFMVKGGIARLESETGRTLDVVSAAITVGGKNAKMTFYIAVAG